MAVVFDRQSSFCGVSCIQFYWTEYVAETCSEFCLAPSPKSSVDDVHDASVTVAIEIMNLEREFSFIFGPERAWIRK